MLRCCGRCSRAVEGSCTQSLRLFCLFPSQRTSPRPSPAPPFQNDILLSFFRFGWPEVLGGRNCCAHGCWRVTDGHRWSTDADWPLSDSRYSPAGALLSPECNVWLVGFASRTTLALAFAPTTHKRLCRAMFWARGGGGGLEGYGCRNAMRPKTSLEVLTGLESMQSSGLQGSVAPFDQRDSGGNVVPT